MSDVLLANAPVEGDGAPLPVSRLRRLLLELACEPRHVRAPLFGALLAWSRHEDPSIRESAFLALRGAGGFAAWRALVDGLSDGDETVRRAAVAAVVKSAEGDPPRIAHGLFHPLPDVRRRTMELAPPSLPDDWDLYLLADAACGDLAASRVQASGAGPVAGRRVSILARHLATGNAAASGAVVPVLLHVFSGSDLGPVLEELPTTRDVGAIVAGLIGPFPCGPSATPITGSDAFDALAPVILGSEPLAEALLRGLRSLRPVGHLAGWYAARIALALLRAVPSPDEWLPAGLAVAACGLPALLADPSVPLALRRAAGARIPVLTESLRRSARPLASFAVHRSGSGPDAPLGPAGSFLLRDDGSLDFSAVECLLRLVRLPLEELERLVDRESLLEAVRRRPFEAMPTICLLPEDGPGAAGAKKLLREVLSSPACDRAARARAAFDLPAPQLYAWLDALSAAEQLSLCEALAEATGAWRIGERANRIDKVAHRLASALPRRVSGLTIEAVLAAVLPHPSSPFTRRLLGTVASEDDVQALAEAVVALGMPRTAVLLELIPDAFGFPLRAVHELAARLASHPDPAIRAWAAEAAPLRATPVASGPEEPPPVPGASTEPVEIPAWLVEQIQAPGANLEAVFARLPRSPYRGLTEALAAVRPDRPNRTPRVCAAIFASCDPPFEVCRELERFRHREPGFLQKMGEATRTHRRGNAPLVAAWAWRNERPFLLEDLPAWLRSLPGDAAQGLAIGVKLATPELRDVLWKAVGHLVGVWKARRESVPWKPPKSLVDVLAATLAAPDGPRLCDELENLGLDGSPRMPWPELSRQDLDDLQVPAASALLDLRAPFGEAVDSYRTAIERNLLTLSTETRSRLSSWIDVRGLPLRSLAGSSAAGAVPETGTEEIRSSTDVPLLLDLAWGARKKVAGLAAERLSALGERGRAPLVERLSLSVPPVYLADVAAVVAGFPAGPARDAARQVVLGDVAPAEVRFRLGLTFLRGKEAWAGPGVLSATLAPLAPPLTDGRLLEMARARAGVAGKEEGDSLQAAEWSWFTREDWAELARLLGERPVAEVLAASPHPVAWNTALRDVLLPALLAGDDHASLAVSRFLEVSTGRPRALRQEAARALMDRCAEPLGWPVLLGAVLDEPARERKNTSWQALGRLPDEEMRRAAISALADGNPGGEDLVVALASGTTAGTGIRRTLVELLLDEAVKDATTERAVSLIPEGESRAGKLRHLAEAFAWGVVRARELTGRTFTIRMASGGSLGFTTPGTQEIHVNPLPLLRGGRDGADAVRGLIVHELGHQKYDADEEMTTAWRQAVSEGLRDLFNLVLDERLERRLRAADAGDGDLLKVLAAWAFQHAQREVPACELVEALGLRACAVLASAPLGVARQRGFVRVEQGRLLLSLGRAGDSYGRFLRALRMGLGNRQGDPKVSEALALFGRGFREAGPKRLLEIARELRRIFAPPPELARLLDLHAATSESTGDLLREREGMTDADLEAEVRAILEGGGGSREREAAAGRRKGRASSPVSPRERESERLKNARFVNLEKALDFDRITNVQRLKRDEEQHHAYAIRVARWSRYLRERLRELGLAFVPDRRRLTGRRLDRSQLLPLVVRGEPRILVSRRRVVKTDLFLGVLVDCSGSMELNESLEKAKLFGTMIAEAARGLDGVDVRLFGFTDSVIFDAGTSESCAVHRLESGGGNNDAAALWHAATVALASARSARLLVMISDGSPTECTVEALRALVARLTRKMGISCAQVAVRPVDHVCFPRYVELEEDDLGKAVPRFCSILERLVAAALHGG